MGGLSAAKISARAEQVAVTATAIDTQNAASLAFAQGGQVDQVTSSLAKQIQQKTRASHRRPGHRRQRQDPHLGIGAKAGVKPGDRFELRRAGKPLGKLVINTVQDTFSVGTYDGADPAKTGDTATAE